MFNTGSLLSILPGPLRGDAVVLRAVSLVLVGNLGNERIIWVRIRQQGTNRQENLGNCERGAPIVLEDIKADSSLVIHITVIDFSLELQLWWLERVVLRELDLQEEHSALVRRVGRTHDGGLPLKHVISSGSSGTVGGRIVTEIY